MVFPSNKNVIRDVDGFIGVPDPTKPQHAANKAYVDANAGGGGGGGSGGSTNLYVGSIIEWPSSVLPSGYMWCNGSLISRTAFADLFAVIGTAYGAGDGSTTFALPNKQGKVGVGRDAADANFDVLGEVGGAKTVTLTTNEMPSHGHAMKTVKDVATSSGGTLPKAADSAGNNTGWSAFGPVAPDGNAAIQATGGGAAHSNLQPYVVVNYIIKYSGAMPTAPSDLYTRVVGEMIEYAGSGVPPSYFLCDGSAVSRSNYPDLYAVIGTTYGAGDGTTTFNLPNQPKGEMLSGSAATGQAGTLGQDIQYTGFTLSVPPGTWLLEGQMVGNSVNTADTQNACIMNVTTGALVGGSRGASTTVPVNTYTAHHSRPVVVTFTVTTQLRMYLTRNGGSQPEVPGVNLAQGTSAALTAIRVPNNGAKTIIKALYNAAEVGTASHWHNADDITSGTLAVARIPNLDASKITTGTLNRERLPGYVRGVIPWTRPTMGNGWLDYGTGYHRCGYTKTTQGIVVLTGLIRTGNFNTTIFTLPVGYRPDGTLAFPCFTASGSTDIYVNADGRVTIGANGSNAYVSLEGIMFPAAGVPSWTPITNWATNWGPYGVPTWPVPSYWEDPLGRVWNQGLCAKAGGGTMSAAENVFGIPIASSVISHVPCMGGGGGYATGLRQPGSTTLQQAHTGTVSGSVSYQRSVFVNSAKRDDWGLLDTKLNAWTDYNAGFPIARYMTFDDGIVFWEGLIQNSSINNVGSVVSIPVPTDAPADIQLQSGRFGSGSMIFLVASNLAAARTDLVRHAGLGYEPTAIELSGSNIWRSYGGINYLMGG